MNNTAIDQLSEHHLSVYKSVQSVLEGETNAISIMSTLACLLKQSFPVYYWVGFYLECSEGDHKILKVGPYQGTMGCLTITPDRGVCGRAYRTGSTQLVDDVHADPEHIACDAASQSEVVIPVRRKDGSIYGVLDVDSDQLSAFSSEDKTFLEQIIADFLEPVI